MDFINVKNPKNGRTYTLEFTRETVEKMERGGFDIQRLLEMRCPATDIPTLFWGAFQANHSKESRNVINDMWKHLAGKEKMIPALIELYNAPLNELLDDPEEDEGKVEWSVGE